VRCILQIGVGFYIRYSKFIADRTVTAACPVCGYCTYRIPGHLSVRCDGCFAYLRIDEEATIREVNLDARSEYRLDSYDSTAGSRTTLTSTTKTLMQSLNRARIS